MYFIYLCFYKNEIYITNNNNNNKKDLWRIIYTSQILRRERLLSNFKIYLRVKLPVAQWQTELCLSFTVYIKIIGLILLLECNFWKNKVHQGKYRNSQHWDTSVYFLKHFTIDIMIMCRKGYLNCLFIYRIINKLPCATFPCK